jgi:hypothetical protein
MALALLQVGDQPERADLSKLEALWAPAAAAVAGGDGGGGRVRSSTGLLREAVDADRASRVSPRPRPTGSMTEVAEEQILAAQVQAQALAEAQSRGERASCRAGPTHSPVNSPIQTARSTRSAAR